MKPTKENFLNNFKPGDSFVFTQRFVFGFRNEKYFFHRNMFQSDYGIVVFKNRKTNSCYFYTVSELITIPKIYKTNLELNSCKMVLTEKTYL